MLKGCSLMRVNRHIAWHCGCAVAVLFLLAGGSRIHAQGVPCAFPTFSDSKSGEKVWRNQPNQICHPIPKFDYTDDGRAIMIKRYPFFPSQEFCQYQKYRFIENKE